MPEFRRKPLVIEAEQFLGPGKPLPFNERGPQSEAMGATWIVDETAGLSPDAALIERMARDGLELIRFARCDGANVYVFRKPEILERTYERVDG